MSHKRLKIIFVISIAIGICFYYFEENNILIVAQNPRAEINEEGLFDHRHPSAVEKASSQVIKRQTRFAQDSVDPLSQKEACALRVQSQVEDPNEFIWRNQNDWNGIVGTWFFLRKFPQDTSIKQSTADIFLRALAQAGALDGIKTEYKNLFEAIELLKQAHQEDPQNSAILVFMAYFQGQLGQTEQESASLKQIDQTMYFNSYLSEISRSVFQSVRNPSDFVNAVGVNSTLSVPDYSSTFFKYLVDKRLNLVGEQMLFGKKDKDFAPIDYSLTLEKYIGRSVLLKIDPSRTDLPDKNWMQIQMANSIFNVYDIPSDEEVCDIEKYWPVTQRLRQKFAEE